MGIDPIAEPLVYPRIGTKVFCGATLSKVFFNLSVKRGEDQIEK
jgi:hypothetical protein